MTKNIHKKGKAMAVLDVSSSKEYEEAQALLKILALGNREIEKGRFTPAEEVFFQFEAEESH